MKIVLGIFFMGILPVLFVFLQRKKGFLFAWETQRRIIYLLTLINVCGVLLWMENVEMAFSVLMGSTIFHLLVVEGICLVQGKRGSVNEMDYGMESRRKGNFGEQVRNFIGKMESSNMYLAISFIILLLLCADYLFERRQGQNVLGRVDGCILILAGVIYFFLEGKNIGWAVIADKIRDLLKKDIWKKIGLLVAVEVCIFIGSCLLVDGMLGVSANSSILPYTVGFLFLSWCTNFVNIDLSSFQEESIPSTCSQESIFSITVLMGICAVYRTIYISTYEIYDAILIALIGILLIFPIKIDSRVTGCCRVTAYFALVFYILYR